MGRQLGFSTDIAQAEHKFSRGGKGCKEGNAPRFVMDNNFDPPRIEVSVGDDVVWNVVSFISHVQIKWAGADPVSDSDVLANGSMHCVKFSARHLPLH